MIASTQITRIDIFAFMAVLVFKLLKSRLFFKKIANFTCKLLKNYKNLECKIFKILLKQLFISASSICMTVPLNFHI